MVCDIKRKCFTPDNQRFSYAKRLVTSETNGYNYMIRNGQNYYETLSIFHYLICISDFLYVTVNVCLKTY